jgi:hypothetical protein
MHQAIEFNVVPMFPSIRPTLGMPERDVILEALDKYEKTLFRADNTLANHRRAAAVRSARLQLIEQTKRVPMLFDKR